MANIKKVEDNEIRCVKIDLRGGKDGEVDALISNALNDEWGNDYIIFALNSEEMAFADDIGDEAEKVDYYYIVYKRDGEGWEKVYEGSEYPEAVGACI